MAQVHQLNVRQVVTVLRDRLASLLGLTHGGTRDLYNNFGWEKNLLVEQLFAMYSRNGLASRICRIYPAATWRNHATIRDEQGSSPEKGDKDYSPFVESVDEFFNKHDVYSYLERADRVAGVGRFGLLVFGFRDGLRFSDPLGEGKYPLNFLAVYADPNITVSQWETNEQDPRYGKPTLYTVNTGNPVVGGGQTRVTNRSLTIHWSRCLHLAEFLDEDETYGIPRLSPIYNEVQDLEKLLGAGAETYWLNSRGGMVWSADKDASFNTTELERMERQAQEFADQLRRIVAVQGINATQLQSSITDPGPLIDKMLDIISGSTGIPKRILIGSERGELSSDQDENNWAQRIEERRTNYAGPKILKPTISKLILTGNIIRPQGEWEVQWPGAGLGPQKAAEVGAIRSNTLRNYVTSPGAELIVPEEEFRKEFLGLDPVSEYADDVVEEPLDEDALLADPDVGDDDAGDGEGDERPSPLDGGAGDQVDRVGNPLATDGDRPLRLNKKQLILFRDSSFGKKWLKTHSVVKPLYIYRPVVNWEDIRAWASEQGLSTLLNPDQLHVTICYSKTPVDWFKVPSDWTSNDEGEVVVKPGGAREVCQLGNEGAVVLRFRSEWLEARHHEIIKAGAVSSYPDFKPHVTITYDLDGVELEDIVPYRGKIILGPECFEEINDDWRSTVMETAT